MKKFLILTTQILLFTNLSIAQQWIQDGTDFIGDTSLFHSMTAVSVDAQAKIFAVSSRFINIENETATEGSFTQVYSRVNGELIKQGQALIDDPNEDSEVGASSLSEDGHTLILGKDGFDYNDINLSGKIEVYQLDDNQWIEKGEAIGGDAIATKFGTSVDINNDGNTIIAGGEEGVFGGTGGYVKVFEWIGGNWVQKGQRLDKIIDFTKFGSSVNINGEGNIIAVGAKGETDTLNNIFQAGSVTLYNWSGNEWQQMGEKFYGINELENLGREGSFSINDEGDKIVIGNRYHDEDKGKVSIYEWDESSESWVQLGNTIFGENQQFGDGVNISGDGETITVTGDFAIQMFKYNTTSNQWRIIGEKIVEPEANVGYGFLNDEGDILTTPGNIIIPEFTYFFASLVRFYKFDDDATVNAVKTPFYDKVLVFPNPSSGLVHIQSQEKSFDQIIVTNLQGKVIFRQQGQAYDIIINFSDRATGIYFVTLLKNNRIISYETLIKQ